MAGEMSPTAQRWVGIAGVVSIVGGSVPYMLVPSAPGSGASAAEITSFYNEMGASCSPLGLAARCP